MSMMEAASEFSGRICEVQKCRKSKWMTRREERVLAQRSLTRTSGKYEPTNTRSQQFYYLHSFEMDAHVREYFSMWENSKMIWETEE